MRLNFKSLKEYKLILMTETEFQEMKDEEDREQSLNRTISVKNSKRKYS